MIDWLYDFWASLTLIRILLGVGLIVVTFVVSTVVVSAIFVRLPANYFHSDNEHHFFSDKHRVVRWVGVGAKNLLGVLLLIVGVVMALPGVPGPGLLTVFIGVMLIDFPRKREIEAKIIGRPTVLSTINNLRAKYNRPPLVLD